MEKLKKFHYDQLQIIYDAYDRIYDIAGHRWHAFTYYDAEYKMSNMFGHYVRSLPQFKTVDPAQITFTQYRNAAAPLAAALNEMLSIILPDDDTDIYAICEGRSLTFRHPDVRDRCMAVFYVIEKRYPRAEYRSKTERPSNIPGPKPTTTAWLPYKD